MTSKEIYESIDQSKLSSKGREFLKSVEKNTQGFTKQNDKVDSVLKKLYADLKIKKPEALKDVTVKTVEKEVKVPTTKSERKKEPKKKTKVVKTKVKKATGKKKNTKPTKTPSTPKKGKEEHISTRASKLAKKDGITFKEARAKLSKIAKEQLKKDEKETEKELDKLLKFVRKGVFEDGEKYPKTHGKQDPKSSSVSADAKRKAKPVGRRVSEKSGETTNQYGTYKNKTGRVYYESRDNRSDRNSVKAPKGQYKYKGQAPPYLEAGGEVDDIFEFTLTPKTSTKSKGKAQENSKSLVKGVDNNSKLENVIHYVTAEDTKRADPSSIQSIRVRVFASKKDEDKIDTLAYLYGFKVSSSRKATMKGNKFVYAEGGAIDSLKKDMNSKLDIHSEYYAKGGEVKEYFHKNLEIVKAEKPDSFGEDYYVIRDKKTKQELVSGGYMYIVQNLKSRGFTRNKEVSDTISKAKTVKGITSMYSKGGSTYAKGGMIEIDEYGSNIPSKLQEVFDQFNEDEDSYKEMERLRLKAQEVGYDFDYDLSGQPTEFMEINKMAKGGKVNLSELSDATYRMAETDKKQSKRLFEISDDLADLDLGNKTFAKGGRTISIVNDGVKFDKSKYKAVYGDYDKDGIVNIDDANPLDKTKAGKVEGVELRKTFDKLLGVKAELDEIMYDAVETLDEKAPKGADIYARTKTPYSILKKLVEKRMLDPKRGLTDMIGTTIAVDNQKELEKVRDDIDGGLLGKVLDRDDFYKTPNAGYMAYHYIVEYKGVPVEVQLKTKNMKKLHEVSHEAYKNGTLNAKSLDSLSKTFMRADKGDAKAKSEISKLLKDKKLLASKISKGSMAKGGKTDGDTLGDFKKRLLELGDKEFVEYKEKQLKKQDLYYAFKDRLKNVHKQTIVIKDDLPFEKGGEIDAFIMKFVKDAPASNLRVDSEQLTAKLKRGGKLGKKVAGYRDRMEAGGTLPTPFGQAGLVGETGTMNEVDLFAMGGGLPQGVHQYYAQTYNPAYPTPHGYAKGGEVTYTDTENYAKRRMGDGGVKIWENYKNIHNQKAVGSFSHTYNKRNVGDYYLFLLDDYDRKFYSHIPLKPNEMLFRNETERGRISKSLPLIKINLQNGRVYFMSDDNDINSDYNDKNPKFEKSSADVNYLSLDDRIKKYNQGLITYDELSESVDKTYAKGGEVDYRGYVTNDVVEDIIKANGLNVRIEENWLNGYEIFGQKTELDKVKSLLNEYNIKSNFRKNQGFGDYILKVPSQIIEYAKGGKTKRSKHSLMQDRRRVSSESWEVAYQKRKSKMEAGGTLPTPFGQAGLVGETGTMNEMDMFAMGGGLPQGVHQYYGQTYNPAYPTPHGYAKGGEIKMSEVYNVNGKDYLFSTPIQNAKGTYTGWDAYEVVYDIKDGEKHLNYTKTKKGKSKYFPNGVKRTEAEDYFAKGGKTQGKTLAENFNMKDRVKNVEFWKNDVIVEDKNGKVARIDLDKGERIELNAKGGMTDVERQSMIDMGYSEEQIKEVEDNPRRGGRFAKGGLTDSKYIPTDEIFELVTKDGKVYENDYSAMQFLSGAYVSDKVVTKADDKDGSQMTLFDKGGKIPKGAIYIKRRDIDFITVGEDEDDKEKVDGKNLFNGFWIDPKKQKTLIAEAKKDGRLGKSMAKGGKTKSSGSKRKTPLTLAKEIRKEGEKWQDAVKRASAILKK